MANPTFSERILIWIFKTVNWFIPWHKLPTYIGVANLLAFRYELRAKNLYDTYPSRAFQGTPQTDPLDDTRYLAVRNSDGEFNSLEQPRMGCVGMRLGRNVPRLHAKAPTQEELLTPDPRIISERLLARPPGHFAPATIINLLAAAWVQFQVHDWFFHENSTTEVIDIPLPEGDTWSDPHMTVARTLPDKPLDELDRESPAYRNAATHWWDGSQIYGSTEAETTALRDKSGDGKLTVDKRKGETFLPRDTSGIPITGLSQNWWIGLELLHTLFALEHNAICDEIMKNYSDWTSDQIFDKARLINCALMAKIHTIEWTPAILAHPAIEVALNANWFGILGEKLYNILGRVSTSESISGIPGSGADQDNVPYSLTEEFVSVYRLHQLIPDNIAFFDVTTGQHKSTIPIKDLAFEHARTPFDEGLNFADVFYSFGVNYPGAVTIRNTPQFLRDLHLPDGRHLDMGVVDILRDRERGVPRYNEFRRLFHMKPAETFSELTGKNETLASELSDIYNGDAESVDLLVGTLCEPRPKGFGFSDTAFRVFILMASRRLKSDRFIATDWNEVVYTREGLDWVQKSTMADVLCRHFPDLRGPLRETKNAFAPWVKVGRTAEYNGKETNA